MKQALIIFYRNPEIGKVKSRLAATVGEERALAIYIRLASFTRNITETLLMDKIVFYSNYIDTEDAWNNSIYKKQLQQGEDLGVRMSNAFLWAFRNGYASVVLIGTDCLDIDESIIKRSFSLLSEFEVVIGPAKDGGYYLLGMNQSHPHLFLNKEWGTHTVLSDTLENLGEINFQLLPVLNDIDEESDLPKNFL